MANFFKDYHKNRITSPEQVKTKAEYKQGQKVDFYGKALYFADYVNDNFVLLAYTRKEALTGRGQIYSIHQINWIMIL